MIIQGGIEGLAAEPTSIYVDGDHPRSSNPASAIFFFTFLGHNFGKTWLHSRLLRRVLRDPGVGSPILGSAHLFLAGGRGIF